MNPERARVILSSYHLTNGDSRHDPEIAEALEVARKDPQLRRWLEDQSNPNPIAPVQPLAETARQSYKRRRVLLSLAAAAVVALAAGTLYLVFPAGVEFPGESFDSAETFRDHMALFSNSRFYLDHNTPSASEAKQWLDERDFPSYPRIPAKVARLEVMGSKMIDWGGKRVGMVSFANERGEAVHLFMVARSTLADLENSGEAFASLALHRGLETGGWVDGDKAYLLVGSRPGVGIGALLGSD